MKKLIATNKYNEKKVSKFILDTFPNLSQNTLFKALRKKDIKINGNRINKDCTILEGDEISVYISDDLLFPKLDIPFIYEDDNILIVNKPVNIEVTGEYSLTSILNEKLNAHTQNIENAENIKNIEDLKNTEDLKNIENLKDIQPCHRLDRNTTGLILFAKNEEALKILLDKFQKHEIKKFYKALVYGIPKEKQSRLEAFLFKDNKESLVYISDTFKKGYSKIITSYNVLKEYSNNTALLNIEIETGKTHQIRAHLAHIGHPIIGDGKYGINSINKELGYKYQQLSSYKLQFCFKSDSGILNYLNNKIIEI